MVAIKSAGTESLINMEKIIELRVELDALILSLREKIIECNPIELLNASAYTVISTQIGVDSEFDAQAEDVLLQQITPYIQSVIVSSKSKFTGSVDDFVKETNEAFREIEEDYKEICSIEWLLSNALITFGEQYAKENEDIRELAVEAQMFYKVAGKRFPIYEQEYFNAVFSTQSETLQKTFNISADNLVQGIEKLRYALSDGRLEPFRVCCALWQQFRKATESVPVEQWEGIVEAQRKEAQNELDAWKASLYIDVCSVAGWNANFVKELSLGIAETDVLFKDGVEFAGWTGNDLPVKERPFFAYDDRYYAFDYYLFVDNFYRAVYRAVCRALPDARDDWNKKQKLASENKTAELIKSLLPGCEIWRNNHYPINSSKRDFAENDLLVLYSDTLFIVEIKAGAFIHTAPINDFESHIKCYKALIEKPDFQCQRTFAYLTEQTQIAKIYDSCKKIKAEIDMTTIKDVYQLSVSLDDMTIFSAKAEKLRFLTSQGNTISLSIADLMVYRDYFSSPLKFLHFIKQRSRATKVPKLALNDELDHLGLYIDQNCYSVTAEKLSEDADRLLFSGYRQKIDYWLSGLLQRTLGAEIEALDEKYEKPEQRLPQIIQDIIRILEEKRTTHREMLSNLLLDLSKEDRDSFSKNINYAIERQKVIKAPVPLNSSSKEKIVDDEVTDYTVFINQDFIDFTERTDLLHQEGREKYVYARIVRNSERQRLMTMLSFDQKNTLIDVATKLCKVEDVPDNQRIELEKYGEYVAQRVFEFQTHNRAVKIGRNELCPCGSGKKYKKCCLGKYGNQTHS